MNSRLIFIATYLLFNFFRRKHPIFRLFNYDFNMIFIGGTANFYQIKVLFAGLNESILIYFIQIVDFLINSEISNCNIPVDNCRLVYTLKVSWYCKQFLNYLCAHQCRGHLLWTVDRAYGTIPVQYICS